MKVHSLCAIRSQQVGCHGSSSFSILCHSDAVIIWYFCPFLDVIRPHFVLGLPRPLLPFILPSISNRCTPFPLIICPNYWHFLFLMIFNNDLFWFWSCVKLLHYFCVLSMIFLTFSCIATFQKPLICQMLAIASLCGNHYVAGFESRLVLLSKALYHTCFICGQRCKWWSRRPKLTLSVISDVKPIIYILHF